MAKGAKLLAANPRSARFDDACRAARLLGFVHEGGKGSHRVFKRKGEPMQLNFQNPRRLHPAVSSPAAGSDDREVRMGSMKYLVEVFWSDEDEGYIALVPDLPGCSAFGATPEDAVHEIAMRSKPGSPPAAPPVIPCRSRRRRRAKRHDWHEGKASVADQCPMVRPRQNHDSYARVLSNSVSHRDSRSHRDAQS
ncbi:MAG: hypothetical protein ACREIR_23895 [Geminicoccaceae bacterium]